MSVELHQWPGTFHGSQAILSADVSQRQLAELGVALNRALADELAPCVLAEGRRVDAGLRAGLHDRLVRALAVTADAVQRDRRGAFVLVAAGAEDDRADLPW